MSIIRSLVVLTLLAVSLFFTSSVNGDVTISNDSGDSEFISEQVHQVISQMTLDQKIGQLFLLGFVGTDFNGRLRFILENYQPGGIILFSRNIKTASQVLNLNLKAQNYSVQKTNIPLIISVDQEGGTVSRIKSSPPQPSALAIGNTSSPELSERIGFYAGKVIKSLGFNLNLAPVLDIANPRLPSFLGTRTFSGDADVVGKFSLAFASGLQKSGVMSTLKHFPGHGNEKFDPHFKIPKISDDLATLENTRLKPFKHLIDDFRPAAIMVAHLAIPKIDPKAQAATYSSILINDLLRKKWGYDGIVITDDIDMAAAKDLSQNFNSQEDKLNSGPRAVRALRAGVDMVMIAWNKNSQKESFAAVKKAVLEGSLPLSEIEAKLHRILSAKFKFNLFENKISNLNEVRLALRDPSLKKAFDDVTEYNLKASLDRQPASLPKTSGKVVVLSRSKYFMSSFTEKLSPKCCSVISLINVEDLNQTLYNQKDSLAVIHVSGKTTASLVNKIAPNLKKRVIIVNTNSPSLVLSPETYAKTINLFTYHPELGGLIAEKIISPFSGSIHME